MMKINVKMVLVAVILSTLPACSTLQRMAGNMGQSMRGGIDGGQRIQLVDQPFSRPIQPRMIQR